VRRTGDPEVAADLTAETFASALVSKRRYSRAGGAAVAWLFDRGARLADYPAP
jgi:RNA polymerase sigma-70 factor (ECF subfamily)